MIKKFLTSLLCLMLIGFPVLSSDGKDIAASSDVSQASLILPYKDISHKWRVLNKMKNQARNLTDDEINIIKKYVFGAVRGEETFLLINCNLRGNLGDYIPKKEITKPLKCRLDYYASQLYIPISKSKLPQNIILYRGIDNNGIKHIFANKNINNYINKPVNEENLKFIKQNIVGVKYEEKGFMSTSYDISCAKQTNFIFEIKAPKNLQALLIEDFGKKQEKEVLVNKNTKWEVIDVSIDTNKKTKKAFYKITVKLILNK